MANFTNPTTERILRTVEDKSINRNFFLQQQTKKRKLLVQSTTKLKPIRSY
jgi:hypothetical protein